MKNLRWRLLPFSKNSASQNMAIDEAIFRLYDKNQLNTIRLYGWKPSAVSIGKHQFIAEEVNINSVSKLGFNCVRRISGGGAVFHDELGELTYSVVTNLQSSNPNALERNYYRISNLLFHPIEKLGVTLDYGQIHCPSVFSDGKKLSGNAQARHKNNVLQHGTILVKFRPKIMYSVLKARPGRTQESMIASVYQHITTLSERLKKDINPQNLAEYLVTDLTERKDSQFTIGELTAEEKRMASRLVTDKYESKDWNYSK